MLESGNEGNNVMPSQSTTADPAISPAESPETEDHLTVAKRTRSPSDLVKWGSIVVALISLVMLSRTLPFDRLVDVLKTKASDFGVWGPVIFGGAYVLAAVLAVPGSALTLASGAVFGLFWGTVIVSIASTTAAAIAFLIARYFARERIEERASRFPRFAAVDRSIGQGGAKIIAMLRLSPVMPFSIGNYLFGLTSIRFGPYVAASWLFMLPGTFMYVYLGHVAAQGLASTGAGASGKTTGEWALLAVGLIATAVVTVYISKLARRALQEHAALDDAQSAAKPPTAENGDAQAPGAGGSRTVLLATVAAVLFSLTWYAQGKKDSIAGIFGPAPVTMKEAYALDTGGAAFDHSAFDKLLRKYVDDDGRVDYRALKRDDKRLDGYIHSIARADFDKLDRDEKLAFLINAYNAFTLRLILDHYPVDSIKEIPSDKRWKHKRWRIGSRVLSLDQIEHEEIRPKFKEPRIHFALVCAAVGCPKLLNRAFIADLLEDQLEQQTVYAHRSGRWFAFGPGDDVVSLTQLYKWYGSDFKQNAGSVLKFAARYSKDLKKAVESERKLKIKWLDYDWKLNDRENADSGKK
jgi:uncharacterized membrane protein YdjX (TVP38/TMEM64 family)